MKQRGLEIAFFKTRERTGRQTKVIRGTFFPFPDFLEWCRINGFPPPRMNHIGGRLVGSRIVDLPGWAREAFLQGKNKKAEELFGMLEDFGCDIDASSIIAAIQA